MRILLVHQNFPGQFKHLAPALAARGDQVMALTMNDTEPMRDIRIRVSKGLHGTSSKHAWAQDLETKIIRAEAGLRGAQAFKREGFAPDVIVGHPAWGDMLFLKEVWPDARVGLYCEFFYAIGGLDTGFDPEFPEVGNEVEQRCRLKLKTLTQRLQFDVANAGLAPTRFQADTYPRPFRERISVVHDGIDCDVIKPMRSAVVKLASGKHLTADDEVVTFVARNLEPYRGYHIFMRALPALMASRPKAHFLIVGNEGTSYGAKPAAGTWKARFLNEVADQIDHSRVHFVGQLAHNVFHAVLAISRCHVYLTYPFVLSWSLLEAMALGAPILGSDTAPVREVITDGENGLLTPFFDIGALIERANRLLDDGDLRRQLGENGRRHVLEHFDLRRICLPRQLAWIDRLTAAEPLPPMFESSHEPRRPDPIAA